MFKFKKNKLSCLLVIFILLSYFLGFYVREISNGAGHYDLELFIWIIVSDLKQDFFATIKNYPSYGEQHFLFSQFSIIY